MKRPLSPRPHLIRSSSFHFALDAQDFTPKDRRALAAEFVAMTLFVWVGCGAAVSAQSMYVFDVSDTRDKTFLLGVRFTALLLCLAVT